MRRVKHGHTSRAGWSPTYGSWVAMRERCYNEKHESYKNYGARGIAVCERWRASFVAFLEDMGARPDGMTLDRIDTSGNYEPGNCRWATWTEQMRNRPSFGRLVCLHGHPYVGENLYIKDGHRKCRACRREKYRLARGIQIDAPKHQGQRRPYRITDATS